MKIVVIDDEYTCSHITGLHLLKRGYDVIMHNGSREGLENILNDAPIDLIILDLMMPDRDGLETMHYIKKHAAQKNSKILLQTGLPYTEDINIGLALGAIACLYKPYKKEHLLETVSAILEKDEPKML